MNGYLPIIRSRAAELRGLKELPKELFNDFLPIIELTRSRRSPKNPGGDISKSLESVVEIMGKYPFIMDMTTLESLQNAEFAEILDQEDGFKSWVKFSCDNFPSHSVPMVHLLDIFEEESFVRQAEGLLAKFKKIALRVPTSYKNFTLVLETCDRILSSFNSLVLILDAGYVNSNSIEGAVIRLNEMLQLAGGRGFSKLVIASSSFPSSVVAAGGGDQFGEFSLLEVNIWDVLKERFNNIDYGDYASIHPMDFKGTVTNWVPRVDIMLEKDFYYYRYRRSEGGYARAAQMARRDRRYRPLSSWAERNIDMAAAGSPAGLSPSFWIANRVNLHITRQIKRLNELRGRSV